MDNRSFRAALDNLDALRRNGDHDEALRLANELLTQMPLSGELLVRVGLLLQLVRDEGSLDEIEEKLGSAVVCAPSNVDASIELGHFLYAVRDKSNEALPYFESAREKAETLLKEALIGAIKCYAELGNWAAVDAAFDDAERHFPGDMDLSMLREECDERRGAK